MLDGIILSTRNGWGIEFVMIAKPGDEIIVTDPSLTKVYGNECTVVHWSVAPKQANGSEYIWAVMGTGGRFWLLDHHYQILEEDGVKAVFGDRAIIISDPSKVLTYCKVFPVMAALPGDQVEIRTQIAGLANYIIVDPGDYRIIKRGLKATMSLSICSDCKGTGKIQLLTSTVKCGCMEV